MWLLTKLYLQGGSQTSVLWQSCVKLKVIPSHLHRLVQSAVSLFLIFSPQRSQLRVHGYFSTVKCLSFTNSLNSVPSTTSLSLRFLAPLFQSLCRNDVRQIYINKSKNVFQMKTSACRDGTLKNQPNKMGTTHNTFTPSLHLVPFYQLCFVFC